MRLKKISIIGFKSFADKTVLNFDAGITCIVGPNGCGKSNIADAFRWVLGEQSAKSLRGAKMPDVIFAGSTQRKPLNFAEVSLTLTDVQGALPIDYTEVTLTRRLHRSGESEYFLNQNLVRLKDLQALFLGSGVGRNAFSIFEQGKLDQVISYSPHERRYIFEEAAGIVRFLQRKKEALKKLEQADLNLSRVKDIHSEVEKQITTLEKQAEQARIFRDVQKQLESLEKLSFLLRFQALEKKQNDLNQKLTFTQAKLVDVQKVYDCQRQETSELKQCVQDQDKAIRKQSETIVAFNGQQELLNLSDQQLQQRIQEALQREKRLKREIEEIELAKSSQKKALKDLQIKKEQLEIEWKGADKDWASKQNQIKIEEENLKILRSNAYQKQQTYINLLKNDTESQSQLQQVTLNLQHLKEQMQQNHERITQAEKGSKQLSELVNEKKKQLQQASALVDAHQESLANYEEELKQGATKKNHLQIEIDQMNRFLMEIKARYKILLKMKEDHEGFSSGSKRLLQETQNPQSPLFEMIRPLYEYLQPEKEWSEFVATALRPYSQTLVIENETDFQKVLDFSHEHQLQDFSLFCLSWIKKNSNAELSTDWKGKINSHNLSCHFLNEIKICDFPKIINHLPHGEQLMKEGSFIDHRGVWFKTKPNENQLFLRESELKKIEKEMQANEKKFAQLESQFNELQKIQAKFQMERSELDKILRRDEMKLVEINFSLQRGLSDVEKNKHDSLCWGAEKAELQMQLNKQEALYEQMQQACLTAKNAFIEGQKQRDLLQSQLSIQEEFIRKQMNEEAAGREHHQQLTKNRQHLEHQVQLIMSKEQDQELQLSRLTDDLEELADLKINLHDQGTTNKKNLSDLVLKIQEAKSFLTEEEKKAHLSKGKLEQLEKEFFNSSQLQKKFEQDKTQLTMQIEHQKQLSLSLTEEFYNRFQLSFQEIEISPVTEHKSLEQVERQIKGCRHTLQENGNVNLTAIEELEKYQARFQFIQQQMDDMSESKQELLAIIDQLDQESRELFKETFEQIRTNFRKNFQILFNGGEADLELTTETKNILEAGIEISAKPPGKQMRSISLLSGGEKCLTAVALLFALFEVKPAPFCILDEIDAPLDDTNVERFLNVVKHFVDRCQFLIITHNKRTMAIGDVLFGVSMEEKGVSKLLSLEFSHQTAPEAVLV